MQRLDTIRSLANINSGTTTLSADVPDTTVLLIRHAETDAVGRCLSGRATGVPLNAAGTIQAERLGQALAGCPLAAIYTSPLERAVQTAAAIGRYQAVPVRHASELLEIDFGRWTGKTFIELELDQAWQQFNSQRSTAVIPGGEPLAGVQARIIAAVSRLGARHAGTSIALVSHADVVRCAVLHYLGATLDEYARFEIDTASVTGLSLGHGGTQVVTVNARIWPPSPDRAPATDRGGR
jgi:broad specificity phosphatase PhoE